MYVCLCRAVTDRAIQKAIDQGATSYRDIRDQLDAGTCCGKCVPDIRDMLDEQLARLAADLSVAA